jgi:hypothetical protein
MGGMGLRIELMTLADLAGVLADHAQFWGDRDLRFLHQKVFVQEFSDTCLVARGPARQIAGYLLGFTTRAGLATSTRLPYATRRAEQAAGA